MDVNGEFIVHRSSEIVGRLQARQTDIATAVIGPGPFVQKKRKENSLVHRPFGQKLIIEDSKVGSVVFSRIHISSPDSRKKPKKNCCYIFMPLQLLLLLLLILFAMFSPLFSERMKH